MREILFRARGLYKDRWYYGFYVEHKRSMQNYIIDLDEAVMDTQHLIDKETLGQYTGLTDKNGTKIFEGDILLVGGTQKVVVSFEDGQFVVSHYAINLLKDRTLESEVIGNIYDNPELLEVDNA